MVDVAKQFDGFVLQQIFLEDHKEWTAEQFNTTASLIAGIVRNQLTRLDIDRLSNLNRRQLNQLISNIEHGLTVY